MKLNVFFNGAHVNEDIIINMLLGRKVALKASQCVHLCELKKLSLSS